MGTGSKSETEFYGAAKVIHLLQGNLLILESYSQSLNASKFLLERIAAGEEGGVSCALPPSLRASLLPSCCRVNVF